MKRKTRYGKLLGLQTTIPINYKLQPSNSKKYSLYMRHTARDYKYMDEVDWNISGWKLALYARRYLETTGILRRNTK